MDEFLCHRIVQGEGSELVDWSFEIAAAHKVRMQDFGVLKSRGLFFYFYFELAMHKSVHILW